MENINLLDKYRIQNPQYNNVDDEILLKDIYNKHYNNMDYNDYKNKVLNTKATFNENISQIDLDIEQQYEYCKSNTNAIACISPKRLKEIKTMKPMGFFEAFRGLVSFGEDDDKKKFNDISEKYNNNQTLTKEESDFIKEYVDYQAQLQLRGVKTHGKILGGIVAQIPRLAQFMAVNTAIQGANALTGGVLSPLTIPLSVGINTFIDNLTDRTKTERIYNNFVKLTDKGEMLVKAVNEADKKLEGTKAFTNDLIENSVEVLLEPIMGLLGSNISKAFNIKGFHIKNDVFKNTLKKVMSNRFTKLISAKAPTANLNGLVMEEFEEIITDALNNYIVEQEPFAENFKDTIIDRDWLSELGIIAGTGVLSNTTMQGIEYLKNKGATSSDLSTFNSLKETDKENIVNAINDKQNEEINQKFNNDIETIKQQAINNGLNEQEVNNSLELFKAQVEGYANNTGINKVKLLNKLKTEINVVDSLTQQGNEVFNQSLNNDNIYYQSAYHGSPYSFDKFTLDHIGSGEGAQAHGWGLYFALDKKTAERYKRNLTREKQDVPTIDKELYYDGKKLNEKEKLPYVILYNINSKTKKEKEKFLKNNIKFETDEIKKASQYILDNELLEIFDENKLKTNKENLYQVEIPNDDVMLFEEKTFEEQPEKVKESLRKLIDDYDILNGNSEYYDEIIKKNSYGYQIYDLLFNVNYNTITNHQEHFDYADPYKKASELTSKELNTYGIKGIRYNGEQDGECAVVFDDKAIDILNILYQNQNNTKKGSIEFLGDKSIINLVKGNYDQSTLTHELSHNFLKLVELSKDTNEFTKAKWDEIQKVFKDESETKGSYYSTQEKFARSWESYLRRGIAPTNKLKAIFEEFREWLTNIYQSIKDLNINLSPDAIKFFDSILISNETFNNENFQQAYEDLQNEINNRREVLYQEGKTEQEVENTIEKEFKDRLAKIEEEMQSLNYKEYNVDEYLKKLDEYKKSQGILSSVGNIYNNLTDFLNETIVSENQNIREISEKIYMKYLNMDFVINQDLKKYSDILEKFNKSVLDLKKNNSKDYEEFSIAWYNNNMEEIENISTKYGFFEEFKNVRAILEELYDRQVEVGVDIGYRKNYLPTRIKANEFEKVKNVIAEKYGSDILSELEKVATGKGYLLNSPEGISLLSNYLRGYTPQGITLSPSNFTKQRTLERSSDFYPFYQTFEKSLSDYISQTTRNINERAFFGKSTAEQQKELTKLKRKETQLTKTTDENKRKKLIEEISELRKNIENTNINLESSIGKVIAEELPNISVKDADKLKDFLLSLFKKEPTGKLTQATNTLSGIYVLPNPKSALKQLTELSASIRDFGLNKTITSLFSKNLVNMKDLGLDVDINEPSKLQNLYSKALKSVGFDKADMIGKNTYLNSAFLDTQEKIKNNDKKTISNLEMMFEDKAEEVKEKFLQGKATDYDVMSYLFYLINDTQPLSSGSKTKYFNDHPSLRWMYNLKSYLIQQISFVKNNVINEAKKGNIATATKNLVNLQLSLWFTGVPISMIADILFGDDDDRTLWEKLPDFMIDNLILNNILNRFNLLKIIGGNIGDFVLGFTTPAFVKPLNYLGHDLFNIVDIINGEKESKLINKNSTIKQFKNLVEKLD